MDVNEELKYLRKFKKKKNGGLGSGEGWLGGQGGCERRIKVFVKIQKKKFFGGGGAGVGSGGGWLGGQGGCERRIEVFAKKKKNQKKNLGGGGVRVGLEGVRVDVKVELKFL